MQYLAGSLPLTQGHHEGQGHAVLGRLSLSPRATIQVRGMDYWAGSPSLTQGHHEGQGHEVLGRVGGVRPTVRRDDARPRPLVALAAEGRGRAGGARPRRHRWRPPALHAALGCESDVRTQGAGCLTCTAPRPQRPRSPGQTHGPPAAALPLPRHPALPAPAEGPLPGRAPAPGTSTSRWLGSRRRCWRSRARTWRTGRPAGWGGSRWQAPSLRGRVRPGRGRWSSGDSEACRGRCLPPAARLGALSGRRGRPCGAVGARPLTAGAGRGDGPAGAVVWAGPLDPPAAHVDRHHCRQAAPLRGGHQRVGAHKRLSGQRVAIESREGAWLRRAAHNVHDDASAGRRHGVPRRALSLLRKCGGVGSGRRQERLGAPAAAVSLQRSLAPCARRACGTAPPPQPNRRQSGKRALAQAGCQLI
jgi:hypothetical protein